VRLKHPPKHLRPATKKWWREVNEEFELEPHHQRLLTLTAEAWDRTQQAREVLAAKGLTFNDRFGQPKPRPEVAIERDSRIAFARILRELALDVEVPGGERSRPPQLSLIGGRPQRTA
jgi:P27 family predicted phage terminase small subunit